MLPSLTQWWHGRTAPGDVAVFSSFDLDIPRTAPAAAPADGDEDEVVDKWDDIELLKEFAETTSCSPLFLLVRNKSVVGRVEGANAPEVIAHVNLHLPDPPTEDEY